MLQNSSLTVHGKNTQFYLINLQHLFYHFQLNARCNKIFCHKFYRVFILVELEMPFCFEKISKLPYIEIQLYKFPLGNKIQCNYFW